MREQNVQCSIISKGRGVGYWDCVELEREKLTFSIDFEIPFMTFVTRTLVEKQESPSDRQTNFIMRINDPE